MAQAKRKSAKSSKRGAAGERSWGGLGMLLIGVVSGALAMQLWHAGGAGLRQMVERHLLGARDAAPVSSPSPAAESPAGGDKPATDFTFFTVLPEIEVVAPAPPAAESTDTATDTATDTVTDPKPATTSTVTTSTTESPGPPVRDAAAAKPASSFMLQAGSYRAVADAERLRANLGLRGLKSQIQKVTIGERGDFYRVRLGPFATYQAMEEVHRQLGRAGVKALRLKMKSG